MKQYRFRRWLRNWLTNFDADQVESPSPLGKPIAVRESDTPDGDKAMNLRIWIANGGRVIQTTRYDRHKDRSNTSMYVITDDQDFGREIDKIVTMEGLRG